MSNNIAGKVVVITGASSGLGEATARLLSAQGASLALGASVSTASDRSKTN
jgi:NAD(P)-dependent dehydrogenase (short-subunit alcohol dehydrogenase family)